MSYDQLLFLALFSSHELAQTVKQLQPECHAAAKIAPASWFKATHAHQRIAR